MICHGVGPGYFGGVVWFMVHKLGVQLTRLGKCVCWHTSSPQPYLKTSRGLIKFTSLGEGLD